MIKNLNSKVADFTANFKVNTQVVQEIIDRWQLSTVAPLLAYQLKISNVYWTVHHCKS